MSADKDRGIRRQKQKRAKQANKRSVAPQTPAVAAPTPAKKRAPKQPAA